MGASGLKTVVVRIQGRVQGVWYRGWTVEQASLRGLKGWVRNRSDGDVEALFHGPVDQVDEMLEACRKGPPAARVTDIACEPTAHDGSEGFVQKPTV